MRPHRDFRGYQGTVASGVIRVGDTVMAVPSGKTSTVESIVTFEGQQEIAFPPQAVTLTLNDEIDLSRGDMLVRPKNVPHHKRLFKPVVWMHEEVERGRNCLLSGYPTSQRRNRRHSARWISIHPTGHPNDMKANSAGPKQ